MGLLDAPLRSLSRSLLTTFGTSATVRKKLTGKYNPSTGAPAVTPINTDVRGVFGAFSASDWAASGAPGSRLQLGDRLFYVAAADLDFTVEPEDEVVLDGAVFEVVSVETVRATDQAALYALQLRGRP